MWKRASNFGSCWRREVRSLLEVGAQELGHTETTNPVVAKDLEGKQEIVEILFSKETWRAIALEIISVQRIEVSEGMSIFTKKEKSKYR